MATGPFGLTPIGYNLQRIPEFRAALETAIGQAIPGANIAEQSVFGQIIGVFAAALAEREEQNFNVFQSIQLQAAGGFQLDNLGAIMGIVRDDMERDTAYRLRLQAVSLLNATPQNAGVGLCAALRALPGVELANILTDTDNSGYEVVILGGDDEQIAQTIFAFHPTGLNILGTSEAFVQSGCGFCQTIRFTRPTPVEVHLRLVVQLLPGPCDCDVSNTAVFEDALFQSLSNVEGDACMTGLGATFFEASFYQPLLTIQPVNIISAEFSIDGGATFEPGPLVLGPSDFPVWLRNNIDVDLLV